MAKGFSQGRQWNWHNFWICLAIGFLGQMACGYAAGIIGVTLAQPAFLEYMGLLTSIDGKQVLGKHADSLLGATTGAFQAGAFFGALIGSWVMDKYGRKIGAIYCASLSIISGVCICAAQNIAMFIIFRFLAGAGCFAFAALIPVYTTELAPPKLRGFFVGMNAVGVAFASVTAPYMGLAFYFSESPAAQWRAPLGLALIFPVALLLVLLVAPESPRWLLMVNRVEEAREIIMKIHFVKGDPDQEYARGEFYQMQKQTELDQTLNPTWKQMFTRPSYRKRIILGCGFVFVGQSTAVLVINNYGPLIYKALGYGTLDQLILQCGWITLAIPSNLLGTCIMDRVGRKPLILASLIGCCASLIFEAASIASFASPIGPVPNKVGLRACVAAMYLFQACYGAGIDAAGVVFYSEIFPNHLRAKGVSLVIASFALTDLVYLQVTPTAFANIGWKFFLVFIIISGLGTIWIYLYIPETKGMPLEEMAVLFGDLDEVKVFSENIRVDRTTHELVVDTHGGITVEGEAGQRDVTKSEQSEKVQEAMVQKV